MHVTVNGDGRDVREGSTVAEIVDELGRTAKGMAVAVNEEVVPRSAWSAVELQTGDRVEVLVASQGG